MFKYYNHLGFMSKYFIKKENKLIIKENFNEIIEEKNYKKIDPVSVIEILNKNYFFADRTIIKDIYKTPWMSKPNKDYTDWVYYNLPKHGNKIIDEKKIAKNFYKLLRNEIYNYCEKHKNIGVLLSGGMDSRIVSGVLNELIKDGTLKVNVTALNWGINNSRDVVYSKRIANILNWKYKHFDLNIDNLIENIDITYKNGCQFSPIHLHAMPQIKELDELDCILAGSFGDSIGRAEYSGHHVSNLQSISKNLFNLFKVFRYNIYNNYSKFIKNDINKYRKIFPRDKAFQYFEIERQAHYMRKQLNPCLEVINQKIPVYQIFTSPNVFGYMWSINPSKRNDLVYKHLLDFFSEDIKKIPWARTGKKYLNIKDNKDSHTNYYHQYGYWIRNDLSNYIEKRALSNEINSLNMFNMKSIENLIKYNKIYSNSLVHTKIDEFIIWLAALAELVNNYNVSGFESNDISYIDKINGKFLSKIETIFYITYKNII